MKKEQLASELRAGKRFKNDDYIIFYNEHAIYNGKSPYRIRREGTPVFASDSLIVWESNWQEIVPPKRELCTIEQLMYFMLEKPRAYRINSNSPWSVNDLITENSVSRIDHQWCDITKDGFGEPHHFYLDEMGL